METTSLAHGSAEKKSGNKELFSTELVEGTPFTLITDNVKNKCWLAYGNYRITETGTREEVLGDLENNMWHIITRTQAAIVELILKEKKIKP